MAEKTQVKQRARRTEPIAMSRIEHGEMVDGKNVVTVFEPDDVVSLGAEEMARLAACGAIKQLSAEAPE